MTIPTLPEVADHSFDFLDLVLDSHKKTKVSSLSNFDKQSELFHEKFNLIAESLAFGNKDADFYINDSIGSFLASLKEFSQALPPLTKSNEGVYANKATMVSNWYIPYVISVVNQLEDSLDKDSVLIILRDWLQEIWSGSDASKQAESSKLPDIEAFIRDKVFSMLPRGVSSDIKNLLSSGRGWSAVSFDDNKNKQLILKFESDLKPLQLLDLIPKIQAMLKVGGILRKGLKDYDFEQIRNEDNARTLAIVERCVMPVSELKNLAQLGKEIDSSEHYQRAFELVANKLIKESKEEALERDAVRLLIRRVPLIAYEYPIELVLIVCHEQMKGIKGFDPSLLTDVLEKAEQADDDIYKIIIANAHEKARQEFLSFLESSSRALTNEECLNLSCIVVALSSQFVRTMQNNKMTKILSIMRDSLGSNGDFCTLPTFSTCFTGSEGGTCISLSRFDENSQLMTYSIRVYNQHLIASLPTEVLMGKLILPLWQYDIPLEEYVFAIQRGGNVEHKASPLTKNKRFWRVDSSTAYEVMRDINFYISIFGIKINETSQILPLGLSKYCELNDSSKKNALKGLDPEQFKKDEAAYQRSIEAKRLGLNSFTGSDGLPVFLVKR